jgi:hypothetical protein
MPNENCLAGMVCPACGSEEPFLIACTSSFYVHDNGAEEHEDVEWADDSGCYCVVCGHKGTVKSFTITT